MKVQEQTAQTIAEDILASAGIKSETGAPIKLQALRTLGFSGKTSLLTKLLLVHLALKVVALLTSLLARRWAFGPYTVSWAFLAVDLILAYFWTGRKMLSKKLWTIIDPEGVKTNYVESGVSKDSHEEKTSKGFYWTLHIAFAAAWFLVFIVYLCTTEIEWIVQSMGGVAFNSAVVYSFKMMFEDQCKSASAQPRLEPTVVNVDDSSACHERLHATDNDTAL